MPIYEYKCKVRQRWNRGKTFFILRRQQQVYVSLTLWSVDLLAPVRK